MSIARKHFQRQQAQAQAQTSVDDSIATDTSAQDLHLQLLGRDSRALKGIQSLQARNTKKAEFLDNYQDYLDGVLQADVGGQDDIVATLMVWHIDCGETDRGLQLANYVLRHDLSMPERFNWSAAIVLVREITEQYFSHPDSVSLSNLQEVLLITADHDKPDKLQAQLHKALGNAIEVDNSVENAAEQALEHYRHAMQLDNRAGVKKQIDRLQKGLTASPEPTAAQASGKD